MACNKPPLAALLIAGIFAGICCMSGNSVAETDAPAVKLGTNWYKAAFDARFPPLNPSLPPANGWVVLYKNKADLMGEKHADAFQSASKEVNAALTAQTTTNPFRELFPNLYTQANIDKRGECPVLAVPFELDDKTATKEWVVAFSAKQCLSDDESEALRGGDTEPHQWVLQKTADAKFRVLAEGDGSVYVTRHRQEQGYKEIRTGMLIKRAFPADELQCGGAELTWRYRNNRYYLADTEIMAQDCQPLYFPELTGEAWQNAYNEYARRTKVLVDQWVTNLSPAAP